MFKKNAYWLFESILSRVNCLPLDSFVNGALDKVRNFYYPAIFFPKLAATVERFYQKFESVFYLKPISDKGAYGWLYRVYPEPWQVVLQTVKEGENGANYVEDTVVYVSDKRPSYELNTTNILRLSLRLSLSSSTNISWQ